MRTVKKSDDYLELREVSPEPVVSGIFFLGMGLLPYLEPALTPNEAIQDLLFWVISPALIGIGLLSLWWTVRVRIELDRRANRVLVSHQRLLWSKTYETTLNNIALIAIENKDNGDGITFRTKFYLHSGAPIYWSPNRKMAKDKIDPVKAWLNQTKPRH